MKQKVKTLNIQVDVSDLSEEEAETLQFAMETQVEDTLAEILNSKITVRSVSDDEDDDSFGFI